MKSFWVPLASCMVEVKIIVKLYFFKCWTLLYLAYHRNKMYHFCKTDHSDLKSKRPVGRLKIGKILKNQHTLQEIQFLEYIVLGLGGNLISCHINCNIVKSWPLKVTRRKRLFRLITPMINHVLMTQSLNFKICFVSLELKITVKHVLFNNLWHEEFPEELSRFFISLRYRLQSIYPSAYRADRSADILKHSDIL